VNASAEAETASRLGTVVAASRSVLAAPSASNSSSTLAATSGSGSDFPAARASASELAITETDRGTLVTLPGDVLFDFDRAEIRPDAEPVLAQLAELIAENGPSGVEITGHTDSRGSEDYNQALSERRADAARNYLVDALGLDVGLFTTQGRGELEPVAANERPDGRDDPEGRQLNRRVEFLLLD
jgi:outer membrane protein OmpA-like peptidoglycan-associated protein